MDPRVRLLVTMVLSCIALASRTGQEIILLFLFVAAVFSLSRTGPGTAWSGFRPFFYLLLFTVLLQLFLTPGRPIPWLPAPIPTVTYEGFLLALIVLSRLSAVILLSTHLVTTTSPLELSRSLGWSLGPGRRIGLPVDDLVLMLNLGFQFFPILLEESYNLRLALESRGISLRHHRFSYRLQALSAWVLALLTAAMERARRLALALEAKNYGQVGGLRLRFPAWRRESTAGLFLTAIGILCWSLLRLSTPADLFP